MNGRTSPGRGDILMQTWPQFHHRFAAEFLNVRARHFAYAALTPTLVPREWEITNPKRACRRGIQIRNPTFEMHFYSAFRTLHSAFPPEPCHA